MGFKKIFVLLALVSVFSLSCSRRDNSDRDRLSGTGTSGVADTSKRAQSETAQSQAASSNVKVEWVSAEMPVLDSQNNIVVTTVFNYNGKPYQVSTNHQVMSATSVLSSSIDWPLNSDNMSVTTNAGCSDSNCSQYAITYNFKKNGQEVIQNLVWIDFTLQNKPRVHFLSAGQFWDLAKWYSFASDANNFTSP